MENNNSSPFSIGPFNAEPSACAWYGKTHDIATPCDISYFRPVSFTVEEHPWYEVLSDYKNSSLIYVTNKNSLQKMGAAISCIINPVLILSEYELPEETDLPDNVTALTLEFSSVYLYYNDFMERNYPMVFHYFNTFDLIVRIINPNVIIAEDTDCFQLEVLSCISKYYHIPFTKK